MNVIAINGSPRKNWNTGTLVREAAQGATSHEAEVEVIDLYKLESYSGCISCFGCKLPQHLGTCIHKDGLTPVLDKIRHADGLILGSPIYLGEATAGFRALYERLIFPYVSYKTDPSNYNTRKIPVALIFTSNCPEEAYATLGYDAMIAAYKNTLEHTFGSVSVLISSDTLQVDNYERYDWTILDPEKKKERNAEAFPQDKKAAFAMGQGMVR